VNTFIAILMYSLRIVLCTFVTIAMCDCHVVIKRYLLTILLTYLLTFLLTYLHCCGRDTVKN